MTDHKCARCGLVNFAENPACRRCGAPLRAEAAAQIPPARGGRQRGFGRRVLWVCGMTAFLLAACYASLLVTSEGLDPEQRRTVARAITILERAGFSSEAFAMARLVSYRATDNWWNRYVGHQSAYAATNFPFGVVTLYAPFFKNAVDEVERAAILLHESHHVFGGDEVAALEGVWLQKHRLGWTADAYSQTRVWRNTREWTVRSVPALFRCGADRRSDCLE
jgi:hypothetical protein